ncbi:hypothetical protein [Cecembia sp.]|uniref:hypothetical protein n=1 Tax=Cecembia sp. TaxID=1898110 RepID=UPI0025BC5BB0|nr:hypothetical protein [Cecembia sp.]
MAFNENSRVKIPAILHLMRLGYSYIPLSQQHRREESNVFEDNLEYKDGIVEPKPSPVAEQSRSHN